MMPGHKLTLLVCRADAFKVFMLMLELVGIALSFIN